MVCSECKCKYYPECSYGEDTDPCDDCMNGADGSHKRLPRSCRLRDDTELPGAEWDDDKIAEVTLPEAWQYFCTKLIVPSISPGARSMLLSRFEGFYNDELEPMLYDDLDGDETDADDEDLVPNVMRDIKDIFTKMQDVINSSEETSKLVEKIQKVYKEKIEPKLCDTFGEMLMES